MTLPPIDLFIHTYSFRFRLMHDPDFSIVDLLDRAVADGNSGIGLNVNGPHYRFLGGDSPAHVKMVAEALRDRGLEVDVETSSTDPKHLTTLLDLAVALGAKHLRTYTRHEGPRAQVLDATIRDLVEAAPIAEAAMELPGDFVLDGEVIGEVTSGTFSPTGKVGIALALLATSAGLSDGDEVLVDVRGRPSRFAVTTPPFVDRSTR